MIKSLSATGFDISNGADLLLQLAFAGVSATFINTVESPAVFLHNYAVNDAQSLMKLKKACEVMRYRLNASVTICPPKGAPKDKHADFCLIIDKPDRAPIFWEDYKACLAKPFDFLIGVDEQNAPVVGNLEELPHLLIAGETGGGKSVLLHSIIQSLFANKKNGGIIYSFIDTKQVELAQYRDDCGRTATTFTEAFELLFLLNTIMDNRYAEMHENGLTKSDGCHYVVVIDELADLMLQDRKLIEPLLVRLAQMGRAANIHLIIATQRPTVDVCTGHLKANIPSRIALKTASARDSMNIIDRKGAEGLRGKGDALVKLSTDTELRRVQCFNNKTKITELY